MKKTLSHRQDGSNFFNLRAFLGFLMSCGLNVFAHPVDTQTGAHNQTNGSDNHTHKSHNHTDNSDNISKGELALGLTMIVITLAFIGRSVYIHQRKESLR